ncbi:MAG: hypothetical protein JW738_05095 [Actinobacteria bacterium]|nr:hypothetical protein [Actinomycetota bacterium]
MTVFAHMAYGWGGPGFSGVLAGIVWAASVFGCWWLARNSAHHTGYAVFWGIVGGIIALPFYLIFYYRDRDRVPSTEQLPLGFFGGHYGRRDKACLKCGSIVPESTKYCPVCGNSLEKITEK